MTAARRIIEVSRTAEGFTIVELMIVVLIMGVLLAVAMPVFYANRVKASQRTCYANQRTIEGVVSTWVAGGDSTRDASQLAGVVNASHPLVAGGFLARAPRCPSAPAPVDSAAPDASTGAYSFDASGSLAPCVFGELGPHGSYY